MTRSKRRVEKEENGGEEPILDEETSTIHGSRYDTLRSPIGGAVVQQVARDIPDGPSSKVKLLEDRLSGIDSTINDETDALWSTVQG